MKTDLILRLGRIQYRQLAELAKQKGCCLAIGAAKEMKRDWGMFNPFPFGVHADASIDCRYLQEKIVIQISATVDAPRLRSAQRPEIDWSQLEDDEIYRFIVQHEIGHFRENHFLFDVFNIKDPEIHKECLGAVRAVNEILADRFAWNAIRPGEPVPLCEAGKRLQERMAEAMVLLDKHMPRSRYNHGPLPAGQYLYVPTSMLKNDRDLAYVGPEVSAQLVERVRRKERDRRSG